ncbi:MAG: tetratricopeptide repeat protein [Pseudomonadota bacterium]
MIQRPKPRKHPARPALLLGAPLLLSACAFAGGITPQEADVRSHVAVDQFMPAPREMRDNIETQELFAQAAFWSHEYELNPSDLEATLKLAAAVRKLGNPSRAVEITQTARQIHPRDPYLLAEHGAGLIADGRALDAIPVLDQGLRLAPSYARLWSLKGAALDQMEEYQAARDNYARALQITPNDPNVLTNLGLSHALSGDLRTAEMWLRRAADMPGSGAGARQNLALVLQLQGRTEEADRQNRLASLSQGDRRLPPEPVPALTPRGVPADLSAQSLPQQGRVPPSAPQTQREEWGSAPAGDWNAPSPLQGGMPQTRLSTMGPGGEAFTSSSQAARQMSGQMPSQNQWRGRIDPNGYAAPQQQDFGGPANSEQRSLLDRIGQAFWPGTRSPEPQMQPQMQPQFQMQSQPPQMQSQVQAAPQGHVVGPSLRTPQPQSYGQPQISSQSQPGGYAAPGYLPQDGYGQPAYAPQVPPQQATYPQGSYAPPPTVQAPPAQTSSGPARRDRRRR